MTHLIDNATMLVVSPRGMRCYVALLLISTAAAHNWMNT